MSQRLIVFFALIFIFCKSFGDFLNITEIDNSDLLFSQKIKVYVSVLDDEGKPVNRISSNDFRVYESSRPGVNDHKPAIITGFIPEANIENGVSFLLLLDNSGSMYNDINDKETDDPGKTRIANAKEAVLNFLNGMENPKDKAGIASFNSFYTLYCGPLKDKSRVENYLDEIKKPKGDEGWTEIYSSLFLAADDFKQISGRKVIIILSDGENMPYYKNTGKLQKDFGKRLFTYQDDIGKYLHECVTVFVINYGKPEEIKDSGLKIIARETGGSVFDASNADELKSVYSVIRNRILNEYLITYKAGMEPSDKKYLRVELETTNGNINSARFYYSSLIFGVPAGNFTPILLAPIILAIILLWILSMIKFKNRNKKPLLEVLDAPMRTVINRTLALTKNETVIGASPKADMTIPGKHEEDREYATIIYDEKTKIYAVKSKDEIMVNNKPVRTKVLESGDVINAGGVSIVFDSGDSGGEKKDH